MALFPAPDQRPIYSPYGYPLNEAAYRVYTDSGATVPAVIYADSNGTQGAAVANSRLYTNQRGILPRFHAPTAVPLYGKPDGYDGPITLLVPDPSYTLSLEAKVSKGDIYVNALDYGVKGDGTTNDLAALQTAVDAAGPGGTVLLPPRRINLGTGTLNLSKGQTVLGSGSYVQRDALEAFGSANYLSASYIGGTVLLSTNTSGNAVYHMDAATHTGGGLRELALIGPGTGTSVGVRMGRDTPSVKAVISPDYRNVFVANFATGMVLHHVNEGKMSGVSVRGCTKAVSFVHDVNSMSWIGLNMQRCASGLVMETGGSCYCNTFVSPICQNLTGVNWAVRGFNNTWVSPYHEHPSNPSGNVFLFDMQTGGRNIIMNPDVHVTNPMRINITNQCHYNTFEMVDVHTARYDVVDEGTANKFTGDFDNGVALTGTGGNRIVEDRRNAFVQYPSYRATSGSLPSIQGTNFFYRNGTSGPTQRYGAGTAEGVVAAPVASAFWRTDGPAQIKVSGSGNTGWREIQNSGGLRIAEGSNAKQGVSTLVAGTVTVANTSVTATSRIQLTGQSDGGTPGWLRVSARSAGASFTITSSSGSDTSVVAWEIFEVGT